MSFLDLIATQLGGDAASDLSRQLGADPATTNKAIGAAVPLLIGALSRNAAKPGGAEALTDALERDHDGGILDDIGGFLGAGGNSPAGEGILGHVLGGRRDTIAAGISQSSGLDVGAVQKLLPILAPIVMAYLGRQRRAGGLDASGLAAMLGRESRAVESQAGGLIGSLLDADGDGVGVDDVMRVGGGLLGGLLKR